jgi:hypothetical protein
MVDAQATIEALEARIQQTLQAPAAATVALQPTPVPMVDAQATIEALEARIQQMSQTPAVPPIAPATAPEPTVDAQATANPDPRLLRQLCLRPGTLVATLSCTIRFGEGIRMQLRH